ncbi:hypothetical protein CMI37_33250 [Candidatus Pacearchaeota archaeon]|nr:hypothetical protein [Candidatus Pacearchaeota archaeon]
MKKTKEIEVWVCDSCGREQGYQFEACSTCKKELCGECSTFYTVQVERRTPSGSSMGFVSIDLHHEGLKITLCPTDATSLEKTLRAAGFEQFNYTITAV